MMFLDFKKGFDTINHDFLFFLLRELKFKDSFLRWIQTLYNGAYGRVLNFGWISEKFAIERGVRQGCPLSALLFIIVAEVLAMKIKQKTKIEGIQVPYYDKDKTDCKDIRIVQYADDTTIITNSVQSVKEIMKEVEMFGEHAGPKINWTKSNFMKLNISNDEVEDFYFTEDPIKCLGIYVGKKNDDVQNLNWDSKVEKIKNTLDLWKMRKLTLYGKVIVIKLLKNFAS